MINVNDAPTGKPEIISNTTRIEQNTLLTAETSLITDDDEINPSSYTYEWKADGKIIGVESDYELTQAEVNQQISVTVTYKDLFDNTHSIESAKTSKVIDINDQPKFISSIIPKAEEGIPFTFDVQIEDIDNQSEVIYALKRVSVANEPKDIAIDQDSGRLTFTPKENDKNYDVVVTIDVDDKTGTDNATNSKELTIKVNADDDKSTFNTEPLTNAFLNKEYSYTIGIHDPDSDVILSSSLLPEWLELTNSMDGQWLLKGTPTAFTGNNSVVLLSHDNQKQEFDIDVFGFKDASTTINLCFQGNDALTSVDLAWQNTKLKVKQVVENTWGKSSAVKFSGWDQDCNSDDTRVTIRILRKDGEMILSSGDELQSHYYSAKDNIIVLYDYRWTAEMGTDAVFSTINNTSLEHVIAHEFGHLLGFPHEHERLDTYRAGDFILEYTNDNQPENMCHHITYGKPAESTNNNPVYFYNQEGKDKRSNQGLKLISYQDWQESPYDPFSIMNYCEDAFSYKNMRVADSLALTMDNQNEINRHYLNLTETEKNPSLKLSYEDQKRAQRFYGAPLDSSETHLLKNGKFFTGFYKEENPDNTAQNYWYYENGIKKEIFIYFANTNTDTDSPTEPNYERKKSGLISLDELDPGTHFQIKHNTKKANFRYTVGIADYIYNTLYFYKKGALYLESVNYPIAFCKTDYTKGKVINPEGDYGTIVGSPQDCSFVTKEEYSDYSFYYYDSPHGMLKEFNIEFCEKVFNGQNFDSNGTQIDFIDTNNCYDFNDSEWTVRNNVDLYINGELFKGSINNVPHKSVRSGDIFLYTVGSSRDISGYWRIFYAHKYWEPNPNVDGLNSQLSGLLKKGVASKPYYGYTWNHAYYIDGKKASNSTEEDFEYKWIYKGNNEMEPITFMRSVIFATLNDKLYQDGVLFTGAYKNKNYSEGVLVEN